MSKESMYKKLQCVQAALMEETIEDYSLQSLLPLIFKRCYEENLTFWFNFLEDAIVLNLRDVSHESLQLNIRYSYKNVPDDYSKDSIETYKIILLQNAFLLTDNPVGLINITSSESKEEGKIVPEKPIKESTAVPPTSVRTVMDMLEKNNEPVTRSNIQKYLQLDKMSSDNRRRCIAYLKTMEE